MAWRSLFAFSNPNGRIGSTFNAIPNSSLVYITALTSNQKLATFTNLPIGVYSVSVSVSLANGSYQTGVAPTIDYWYIGASINDASPTLELGSVSPVGIGTQSLLYGAYNYTTMNVNFILNNLNGASTIYINSSASIVSNIFTITGISAVATKMA
jgi:hypothetical protein